MNATRRTLIVLLATLAFAGIVANDVHAQRGGFRGGFGNVSHAHLSSLTEVQNDLMLTSDQKAKATEIAEALSAERSATFQQGGGGDPAARWEKLNQLNADATEKLNAVLDENQRSRLNELYVQVNGAAALSDPNVAMVLALTDEQSQQVTDLVEQTRQAIRDSLQDGASREELREAWGKLNAERDDKLLALLTDEQKENFEKMKGDKLEIDLSQLRVRRGGGGRGN
jgi:Spy/CpxP family protein refolding chaperone